MKHLKFYTLPLILMIIFSCKGQKKGKQHTFKVSGNIKNLTSKYIFLDINNEKGERVWDTIVVKNGHFEYVGKINKPTHLAIWSGMECVKKKIGRGNIPYPAGKFQFLASPGENIKFSGAITDFVNAYPSGTPSNDDLSKLNKQIFPMITKSINLYLRQLKIKDSSKITQFQDAMDMLDKQVHNRKINFIRSHPKSEATTWYLLDMIKREEISNEKAMTLFKGLYKNPKNYFYQSVKTTVEGMKLASIGQIVPNFITTNLTDGKTFQISELRGKYILIDFWGLWCSPCMAEIPKVKVYQNRYPKKLRVVGVNQGDSKKAIKAFIKDKNYNWIQLMAKNKTVNLVNKFVVTGFPTKFIIDPSGKIIYRTAGSGEEAFKMLDKVLK